MKSWQEDLLAVVESGQSVEDIFRSVAAAARALGFERCAYGLRVPFPVTNPRIVVRSDYPLAWQQRYQAMKYVLVDPTVAHGRKCQKPLVWSPELFQATPQLWSEANSAGLAHGWAQSNLHAHGMGGMLTLARSREPITPAELEANEGKMRWLVSVAHMALSRAFAPELSGGAQSSLTEREIEVLRWTAEGKTCREISDILSVSEHTVNFHVKNAVWKLQSPNKTSAAVRAAMLGLLS